MRCIRLFLPIVYLFVEYTAPLNDVAMYYGDYHPNFSHQYTHLVNGIFTVSMSLCIIHWVVVICKANVKTKSKLNMIRKWHNHRLQKSWHREEETQNTVSHHTFKVKQLALSSSAIWLIYMKGHQQPRNKTKTQHKTDIQWEQHPKQQQTTHKQQQIKHLKTDGSLVA